MVEQSLSARHAFNAEDTEEYPIVLAEITPAGATEAALISSEPAQRLSTDPLRYGLVHLGREYQWVMMSASVPDDQEGTPPATTLIFANVAEDMAATARGVTPGTQAKVVIKVVLSGAPNEVEEVYEMTAVNATYNAQQVSLDCSREPIETEPWPAQRMTKQQAPGLFR
jgi:hypothetical protein